MSGQDHLTNAINELVNAGLPMLDSIGADITTIKQSVADGTIKDSDLDALGSKVDVFKTALSALKDKADTAAAPAPADQPTA